MANTQFIITTDKVGRGEIYSIETPTENEVIVAAEADLGNKFTQFEVKGKSIQFGDLVSQDGSKISTSTQDGITMGYAVDKVIYTEPSILLQLISDVEVTAFFEEYFDAIYDRTQEDVDRVKYLNNQMQTKLATSAEIQEWTSNLKGALNKADLERIVNNTSYLATKLGITLPYDVSTIPDLPTREWYDLFIANIKAVRDYGMLYTTTPLLPEHPFNTYEKWNDIEKILFDAFTLLQSLSLYFCGDDLVGNDNILI